MVLDTMLRVAQLDPFGCLNRVLDPEGGRACMPLVLFGFVRSSFMQLSKI